MRERDEEELEGRDGMMVGVVSGVVEVDAVDVLGVSVG